MALLTGLTFLAGALLVRWQVGYAAAEPFAVVGMALALPTAIYHMFRWWRRE